MHSPLAKMTGIYIYERRTELGINQSTLAKQLGFSAQFLGRAEKGEVRVPHNALVKAIIFLDLSETKLKKIYRLAAEQDFGDLMIDVSKKSKRTPKRKSIGA